MCIVLYLTQLTDHTTEVIYCMHGVGNAALITVTTSIGCAACSVRVVYMPLIVKCCELVCIGRLQACVGVSFECTIVSRTISPLL